MESSLINLYNPIAGGNAFRYEDGLFDVDKTVSMEKSKAEQLMLQYPFLVNKDDPKYSPDNQSDTRSLQVAELNSGRISVRLSEELKSITNGISKVVKEGNSELRNISSLQMVSLEKTVQQLQIININLEKIISHNEKGFFKKLFK